MLLEQQSGARSGVDIAGMAQAMDRFFWSLLAQALHFSEADLNRWIASADQLMYHAMFINKQSRRGVSK
jgi:hypothetical protein